MRLRTVLFLSIVAVLPGCGGGRASNDGRLRVVAAENVYGNIAAQIGGPDVSVTSVLTNPNADPHLFAAGAETALAVARAKLVIQNGLGYDDFISRIEDATPDDGGMDLVVADALGIHGKTANPHLWYDLPQLGRIAQQVTDALAHQDPAHAAAYRRRGRSFERSLEPLRREVASIRSRFGGTPVAYTEPVPGYLLAAAGLRNLAPAAFTRAIEDGSEPPPAAVAAMDELVAERRIRVLLYNDQAVSPLTSSLAGAARRAGIRVVPVSETLPPHLTFQQWQLRQARALEAALAR